MVAVMATSITETNSPGLFMHCLNNIAAPSSISRIDISFIRLNLTFFKEKRGVV
jgi:hypothetical protein